VTANFGRQGKIIKPPGPPRSDEESESDEAPAYPAEIMKQIKREMWEKRAGAKTSKHLSTKSKSSKSTWQGILPRSEAKGLAPLPGIDKAVEGQEMEYCKALLKTVSDSGIFISNLQVSAQDLHDFILKSGHLLHAQITVHILKCLDVKVKDWSEYQERANDPRVNSFKEDLRRMVSEVCGRGNPKEIQEDQLTVFMAMGMKYDLSYLSDVTKIACGPPPVPSFRYLFYATQAAFSKQCACLQQERENSINFLRKNPIFTEAIQVRQKDLMDVCKGVMFSEPGITKGVKTTEILTQIVKNQENFASFQELISRIKELCSYY